MSLEVYRGEFSGIDRIPTVLDERGLVDPVATVEALRNFLDDQGLLPDRLERRDEHHLYWPYSKFDDNSKPGDNLATKFRDLRINRILLPRNFHILLHEYTDPPPIPDEVLMREYLDSSSHFLQIFRTARSVINLDKEIDKALYLNDQGIERIWPTKERLLPKADGALNALIVALEAYGRTPTELRVMPDLDTESAVTDIARRIGDFIGIRRSFRIVRTT